MLEGKKINSRECFHFQRITNDQEDQQYILMIDAKVFNC